MQSNRDEPHVRIASVESQAWISLFAFDFINDESRIERHWLEKPYGRSFRPISFRPPHHNIGTVRTVCDERKLSYEKNGLYMPITDICVEACSS